MMYFKRVIPILFIVLFLAYCKEDDISDTQEVDIESMLSDDYQITLDPSGNNILTARIIAKTYGMATVEATVIGEHPISMPLVGPDSSLSMEIIGLYPGRTNQIALRFENDQNQYALDTIALSTEELPEYLPEVEVLLNNRSENVLSLAGVSIGNHGTFMTTPMLIDMHGKVRWLFDMSFIGGISYPIKVMENGNLLFCSKTQIFEYNWMGEKINEWDIDGYLQHHEVLETTNETFILAVDKESLSTVEDHIIEIDKQSGALLREWDMRQILDVDRFDLAGEEVDWFHMNAIDYIEDEDALIISGRNQGVVKVDGENNLEWILSPHKSWGKAGPNGNGFETSDFLLQAVDQNGTPFSQSIQEGTEVHPDFNWAWGQHASLILDNGNLFVFDNGLYRNFSNEEDYSRGVEYEINEENMTVRQTWAFGQSRGESFHSNIISDVDVNKAGNRVITAGIIDQGGTNPHARIVEVNEQKDVVFELQLNFKNALSDAGGGWGNLDLCYRSEQIEF